MHRTTQAIINEPATALSAEDLLQSHAQLRDEIAAKDYEIVYVKDLGKRLLLKNPGLTHVHDKVREVTNGKNALEEAWNSRYHEYQQLFDLQTFNREADRIDALTKGHEAFLDIGNLGNSVEGVENLLKSHADFESKLSAQEDRLKAFSETADKLIGAEHHQSEYINSRRNEVLERRRAVFVNASRRHAQLDEALIYQQFRRNADELFAWINEKKRIAQDHSFMDGIGLDRVQRKHQAFVAEVQANEAELSRVNHQGGDLIHRKHYETPRIEAVLDRLNKAWNELNEFVKDKTAKLTQAADKKDITRAIDDANARLDDIERQLTMNESASDLRSVKELIQRKNNLDQDINILETKISDVSQKAQDMGQRGHYDSRTILKSVDQLVTRFNSLQNPVEERRAMLEELLKWHQLEFDADVELHWIEEKRQVADSKMAPRSLTEATNMLKKHEQLENEVVTHEPTVKKILRNGDALIASGHMSTPHIKTKCAELNTAWSELQDAVGDRRNSLRWAEQREQYLFEIGEIENWILEKRNMIENNIENVDEIKAQKVLSALKALQKDMVVYKTSIGKLAETARKLTKFGDSSLFESRQEKVEGDFNNFEKYVDEKRIEMENFIALCNYNIESQELEQWINEQLQIAMSEVSFFKGSRKLLTLIYNF